MNLLFFPVIIGISCFCISCVPGAAKRIKPAPATDITQPFQFSKHDIALCDAVPEEMFCIRDAGDSESEAQGPGPGNLYIDEEVVSGEKYAACVNDQACSSLFFAAAPSEPALGLNYTAAQAFCTWAGKRLPTERELKLARDRDEIFIEYPEWTNDWAVTDKLECGLTNKHKLCVPRNRMGLCSGLFPCENQFVFKRILTYDGAVNRYYGTHGRIAFRCASETPYLTNQPSWMIENPPQEPDDPGSLSASEEKIIHNLAAVDILDKPDCRVLYGSTAYCKDPATYFVANEDENYIFEPYIRNLGGAYVGLAADANYSYIAAARSRVAWLFDYDANILALHRILRTFILESETPEDFVACFSRANREDSLDTLKELFWEDPEIDTIITVYEKNADRLYGRYRASMFSKKGRENFGWLRVEEHYDYIRMLYRQKRIAIVPGDLRKDKTLQSIGKAAKALRIPVRVYYTSNAEEFWNFNGNYRKNVLSLPFDEASVALRTIHEYKWHRAGARRPGFWHYVIHGAYNYQKKLLLPHYVSVNQFKMHRLIPPGVFDLSTIEVPSELPDGVLENGY